MTDVDRSSQGFISFQKDYFDAEDSPYDALSKGQSPSTMIVGCSDSRVDPAILTNSAPGDLFTVRNVANLVPPYELDTGQHGVSAALEFAVCHLNVTNIIVLGHAQCGGIQALMNGTCGALGGGFISRWMTIAEAARERVCAELPDAGDKIKRKALEQAAIVLSLKNLRSFPFIDERVGAGKLTLVGWYFDLVRGELYQYHETSGQFQRLSE